MTSWTKWALIVSAAGVATGVAAGAGYLIYKNVVEAEEEQEDIDPSKPNPLNLARQIQFQELMSAPVRRTPASKAPTETQQAQVEGKKKAFDPLSKPKAASGTKLCANCKKGLTGLPKRCSQCKSVYYCSAECQRQAWPEHKELCGVGPSSQAPSSTSKQNTTSASESLETKVQASEQMSSQEGPSVPSESLQHEESSCSGINEVSAKSEGAGQDVSKPEIDQASTASGNKEVSNNAESSNLVASASAVDPNASETNQINAAEEGSTGISPGPEKSEETSKSLQDALTDYIQRAIATTEDPVEKGLESGALMFMRGDYRGAATMFERVKENAVQTKADSICLETLRWLGHCYKNLANIPKATEAFEAGVTLAENLKDSKLVIDCLSGLGMLQRSQGDMESAISYLTRALKEAEQCKDVGSKASVLCNLGGAVMASDPRKAMEHLKAALALREEMLDQAKDSGDNNQLATAVMDHANTLVNLASGHYVLQEYAMAKDAYETALEIFHIVEDVDKVAKSLVNLANMQELQLGDEPNSRAISLMYRMRLFDFLTAHLDRTPPITCSICLDSLDFMRPTPANKPIIILACFHAYHNTCWEGWIARNNSTNTPLTCPECKQLVPLFGTS